MAPATPRYPPSSPCLSAALPCLARLTPSHSESHSVSRLLAQLTHSLARAAVAFFPPSLSLSVSVSVAGIAATRLWQRSTRVCHIAFRVVRKTEPNETTKARKRQQQDEDEQGLRQRQWRRGRRGGRAKGGRNRHRDTAWPALRALCWARARTRYALLCLPASQSVHSSAHSSVRLSACPSVGLFGILVIVAAAFCLVPNEYCATLLKLFCLSSAGFAI